MSQKRNREGFSTEQVRQLIPIAKMQRSSIKSLAVTEVSRKWMKTRESINSKIYQISQNLEEYEKAFGINGKGNGNTSFNGNQHEGIKTTNSVTPASTPSVSLTKLNGSKIILSGGLVVDTVNRTITGKIGETVSLDVNETGDMFIVKY